MLKIIVSAFFLILSGDFLVPPSEDRIQLSTVDSPKAWWDAEKDLDETRCCR